MYALFKDGKQVSNTFNTKHNCRIGWVVYWGNSKLYNYRIIARLYVLLRLPEKLVLPEGYTIEEVKE